MSIIVYLYNKTCNIYSLNRTSEVKERWRIVWWKIIELSTYLFQDKAEIVLQSFKSATSSPAVEITYTKIVYFTTCVQVLEPECDGSVTVPAWPKSKCWFTTNSVSSHEGAFSSLDSCALGLNHVATSLLVLSSRYWGSLLWHWSSLIENPFYVCPITMETGTTISLWEILHNRWY